MNQETFKKAYELSTAIASMDQKIESLNKARKLLDGSIGVKFGAVDIFVYDSTYEDRNRVSFNIMDRDFAIELIDTMYDHFSNLRDKYKQVFGKL